MNTAKQIYKEVKFWVANCETELTPWDTEGVRYSIHLVRNNKKMFVDFYQGLGVETEPTKKAVIASLLLDATSINDFKANTAEGFLSWCDEYGYEPTMKLWRTYGTIHRNTEALTQLFGGVGNLEAIWNRFNEKGWL